MVVKMVVKRVARSASESAAAFMSAVWRQHEHARRGRLLSAKRPVEHLKEPDACANRSK